MRSPLWLLALAFAGCAARPVAVSVVPPPAVPGPAEPAPTGPEAQPALQGIYRPPKIGKVFLRAHVDANGRLFGPQVVYQIVEPGGWNVEAVEPTAEEPPKALPNPQPTFEADAGWLLSKAASSAAAKVESSSQGAAPPSTTKIHE